MHHGLDEGQHELLISFQAQRLVAAFEALVQLHFSELLAGCGRPGNYNNDRKAIITHEYMDYTGGLPDTIITREEESTELKSTRVRSISFPMIFTVLM